MSIDIANVSLDEKLRLVEALWDEIAASNEPMPVPDWLEAELARRRENFERDPTSAMSWEEARGRLLKGEM